MAPRVVPRVAPTNGTKMSEEEDEWRAFKEWKRKEGEQQALIKNTRKRQEVALREAEGERERVSSALRYSFCRPNISGHKAALAEPKALVESELRHLTPTMLAFVVGFLVWYACSSAL